GEDRARFFYRDVLGLPEQPKPPNLSPTHESSDFDDGWHDPRVPTIGLPHPLADRAADRLRDPDWVGDVFGRQRLQLGLDLADGRLQRLGILGKAARVQMRHGCRTPGPAPHYHGDRDETRRQDEPLTQRDITNVAGDEPVDE